jgi:hypothetical protein
MMAKSLFEARFQNGYLYWDNCGKIWRSLTDIRPDLEMGQVTPDQATFQIEDEGINISFSHQRFGIHQEYPRNLDIYKKFASQSFNVVIDYLQVEEFSRIGNRYQYIVKHDERDEVTDYLKEKNIFIVPKKLIHPTNKIAEPHVKFIIERDNMSIIVQMGYFSRDLKATVQKPLKIDTSSFISKGISIDIDSASTNVIKRGTLDVAEFIAVQEKSVRRIIDYILT